MASILNVDQINNAAGTSAVTLDATTGKASFPNGATLPVGSVVRMGSQKLTTSFQTSTLNTWVSAQTFSITGITSGNTVYINLSLNDLLETASSQYWRLLNNNSSNLGQWGRQTNGNASWRGIRADGTLHDYDTAAGTRNYDIQMNTSGGVAYMNYPSNDSDMASFLTWWEIAQ